LDAAQQVVAAAPDYSWGWSADADSAAQSLYDNGPGAHREELRRLGLQATEKALRLDARNSAALTQKAMLIDPNDRIEQEKLLRRAIAARPLDCGCEHLIYGLMLQNVGRYADSAGQFRRAIDMLALDPNSQFTLGDTLNVIGKPDEARAHFESAVDLDPGFSGQIAVIEATETGNYAAGIKALGDPKAPFPDQERAGLITAYRALASGDEAAKAPALKALLALPNDQKDYQVTRTVAALGGTREALSLFVKGLGSRWDWPSTLWYPSMRGTLDEPQIPAILGRLGLMNYWRTTHTRPDVCSARIAPAFCRMI
jgi:tetratricopeptide (TPR) repeat protein